MISLHCVQSFTYPSFYWVVQNVVSFDEFGDPIALHGAERTAYETAASTTKPSRTWVGWVQYKVTAPFESTLTAVGVSYWIASMLSAGFNSRVSTNATIYMFS